MDYLVGASSIAERGARHQLLWEEWARGGLSDGDMSLLDALAGSLERHRPGGRSAGRRSAFPSACPSRPKSPDRKRSLARRRVAARDGWMPSSICAEFTEGELAVLSTIARACQESRDRSCTWPVARIAGVAGVCHRLAQMATQKARRMGLILWEERPRRGARSDTNVIEIADPGWRKHLETKARKGRPVQPKLRSTGCKDLRATGDIFVSRVPAPGQPGERRPEDASLEALRDASTVSTGLASAFHAFSPP